MNYRKLAKLNWEVSEISLGTWAMGGGWGEQSDEDSIETLNEAFRSGINFIDTAVVYGDGKSESVIGKFIRNLNAEDQSKIKIATKIPPISGYWPPLAYEEVEDRYPEKYLRESVEASLERLGKSSIEIMQLHTWTRSWNKDPKPFKVLQKMKEEGLIQAIGISTPEQDQNAVNQLVKDGWVDCVQVLYNIFDQEPASELLDLAYENGVGVLIRCALDEGSLTGKFTEKTQFGKGDWRKNFFRADRLKEVVKRVQKIEKDLANTEHDPKTVPLANTAIRFALNHPAVTTVICGSRSVSQVKLNTEASIGSNMDPEVYRILQKHAWRRYFW